MDNAPCEACGGSGRVTLHRCPNALMRELSASETRFIRYFFSVWIKRGSFPASGGFLEQANAWVEATEYAESQWSEIEGLLQKPSGKGD